MSWILLVDDLSSPVLYLNDAMYQEGSICLIDNILYSQKYWRSLNLAVWSQAAEIKILADLNLAVALRSVICHYKHCERVYQGALPSSCLRYNTTL